LGSTLDQILAGRAEEGITAFKAYNARNPGFGLADMVIAYQQTNQPEEAKAAAHRADTAQLEADIVALGAAGLPVS
jgi:adenylate cyclase